MKYLILLFLLFLIGACNTRQGMELALALDPLTTVPWPNPLAVPGEINNSQVQLHSAYLATIANTSTISHTFNIEVVPSGFPSEWLILDGARWQSSQMSLPAGGSGQVRLDIAPENLFLWPVPRTEHHLTLNVSALSTASLSESAEASFIMPALPLASLSLHPSRIYSAPGETTSFEVRWRNIGNTTSSFPVELHLPISAWRINPPSLSTTLPPVFLEPGSEYSGEVNLYTPASEIGQEYLIEATLSQPVTLTTSLQVVIVSQNALCAYELAQITQDDRTLSSAATDLGSVIIRFEQDIHQNPDELPGNLALREELLTAIETLKQELAPYSDLRAFRVLTSTTDEFTDLININIYGQLPLLCRDLRTIGIVIEQRKENEQ